ncbi:TIGR00282 family metallophosphoesterase [SAR202 cluster bacterium AC-647-N09_OGT_505m]|nr:TIGR00282 family metallophosphoesterase [SAR202 cluster bacterium AC-647-N09_OGT_505m]
MLRLETGVISIKGSGETLYDIGLLHVGHVGDCDLRALMIGDVIGRPGRRAVQDLLPGLRDEYGIDFVVANGENAAAGFGLTVDTAQELFDSGVDVITSGNHIWDQREIVPYLDEDVPILRPLNYPPSVPGKGYVSVGGVLVVNLIGRVFVGNYDCPFRAMDTLIGDLLESHRVILVDFHAEATSEKVAMGWYLDGRVSAVVGTHTHVGTVDTSLLLQGTAYVSDLGMVGPSHSVIGSTIDDVLERFLNQTPRRLSVASGSVKFGSVMVDIDESTGRATQIIRVDREVN